MKKNIKCPHWDEKNQKCKLVSVRQNEINRPLDIIYQINEIIEGFFPPKTSLGPIPGSHGEIAGHSPIQMTTVQTPPTKPPGGILESLSKIGSLFDPPPDQKLSYWGQEEDQKEKQEYWDKELKKMDKGKKGK